MADVVVVVVCASNRKYFASTSDMLKILINVLDKIIIILPDTDTDTHTTHNIGPCMNKMSYGTLWLVANLFIYIFFFIFNFFFRLSYPLYLYFVAQERIVCTVRLIYDYKWFMGFVFDPNRHVHVTVVYAHVLAAWKCKCTTFHI